MSPLKYLQSGFRVDGDLLKLSLGTKRRDKAKNVAFTLKYRQDVNLADMHVIGVNIIYDAHAGLQAHLMVKTKPVECRGENKASIDLGETNLITAVFSDGESCLVSGKKLKSMRRHWQKVRTHVKPPTKDNRCMSRRYRQIGRKEYHQTHNFLHQTTSRFIDICVKKNVGEIVVGDLSNIRDNIDYGTRMNQRLHAWPFAKTLSMLRYKAEDVGIQIVTRSERNTSKTCHACKTVKKSNRKHRGFYACKCGYKTNADVNGAANIFMDEFHVSPWANSPRSSGRVIRPAFVVKQSGHTVRVLSC